MMSNGFIIAINPNSQLTCLNSLLSRISVSPDFFSENTISSNHVVAAGFSPRSTAIQNSNPLFTPRFCKWGRRGYWENPEKKGGDIYEKIDDYFGVKSLSYRFLGT